MSPRGLAIDFEIHSAVEYWITGDYPEATNMMLLAEYHLKLTDSAFEDKYNEEG